MLRNIFRICLLLLLTSCAAPGTALLSPVFTGAKTKSLHQASLSLASSIGSSQFIRNHDKDIKKIRDNIYNTGKNIFDNFHSN